MKKLIKTEKEFFVALQTMVKFYESYRKIGMSEKKATKQVLQSYDDFYQWLQGEV